MEPLCICPTNAVPSSHNGPAPSGSQTTGAYAHIHESFYMMVGEVVRSETQTYTACKGALVEIPPGDAMHSFRNESSTLAYLLCLVVPARRNAFLLNQAAGSGRPVSTSTAPQSGG